MSTWVILGLNKTTATENSIKKSYRNKSREGPWRHPNKGGNGISFGKLTNAKNNALAYVRRRGQVATPRQYVNKNIWKNFANKKTYAEWALLKKALGRPITMLNIHPYNNLNQKVRRLIRFYEALNRGNNANTLNYLYRSAFGENRRRPNGSVKHEHHRV